MSLEPTSPEEQTSPTLPNDETTAIPQLTSADTPDESTNPPIDDEVPDEPVQEVPVPAAGEATLAQMVIIAQAGRMSPANETLTADLLRQALLGGKPEINEALDAISKLPWPVSVTGLNAAWPEMKPYGRRLFVTGMKGPLFEGEIGRRIRLSLTRGLVKVDEPQAAKWASAIAAEMLGEDGVLSTRDRQSFFNVLVGKGKPWLLRLAIDGLKESELTPLLAAAVSTIFGGGCPPFTQSALLQWLIKTNHIQLLGERSQQSIAQALRKWPGRLLRDFRNVPETLPPLVAAAFAERLKNRPQPTGDDPSAENSTASTDDSNEENDGPPDDTAEDDANDATDEEEEDTKDHLDPQEDKAEDDDVEREEDEDDEDDEDDDEEAASSTPARDGRDGRRKQHPPYVSPGQPNRPGNAPNGGRNERPTPSNFDPIATLRQLDQHIRQQAQQITQLRNQARQRDDDGRRGGRSGRGGRGRHGGGDGVWPDTTHPEDNESLRRYIVQLERINEELRSRLEDLALDGERRVQSLTSTDGTPQGERDQLITFLSLKLAKDYADFQKLGTEPDDEVFREHYRIVSQNVFEILAAEGIVPRPQEEPPAEIG